MVSTLVISAALVVACAAFVRAMLDHLSLRRELEKRQLELAETRRVLAQRGTLASEIAHEVKNPITAILCAAEALDLMLAQRLEPEHRASLRYIKEYGDILLRLVSDFLDLSSAEGGMLKAESREVSPGEVATSISGLLQSAAMTKGVTLSAVDDARGALVRADSRHIKQVLFNLIHNAIKFTPRGGSIIVEAIAPSDREVIVEVRDTGAGISPELLPNLFNPYQRARGGSLDVGTGLGLAVCKLFVESAGGTIVAESRVGEGTTFTIRFPRIPPAEVVGDPVPRIDSRMMATTLRGRRLLVVDNEIGTREAVAQLLQAWGGMVEQVAEASQAVSSLKRAGFDAVVISGARDRVDITQLEECSRYAPVVVAGEGEEVQGGARVHVVGVPFNGRKLRESLERALEPTATPPIVGQRGPAS